MKSFWREAASRPALMVGFAMTFAVLLLGCPHGKAQTSNAQISGLVTDASGAVVPGAQITALNTATNVPYGATSNGAGFYVLQELLPGPYTVTVTAQGFGAVKESGLVLLTGAHMSRNFALKPGAVEESVTVTAAQNLISSDDAASAAVLDNAMITELPQLNRNALDLTATTPSIQGSGPPVDQIGNLGNAAISSQTQVTATRCPVAR